MMFSCGEHIALDGSGPACYEKLMYATRIYYQDTDAGGVVYFANYFKFFEKSWFEYLQSIGISLPEWQKQGTYVLIKTAFVNLIESLRYGDSVLVSTSIKEVRNTYFVLNHTLSREGRETTRGETTMVCVNESGRPRRIPGDFRERLLAHMLTTE
jgi:acyl-CoA thioester hydrolase